MKDGDVILIRHWINALLNIRVEMIDVCDGDT